ncbi:D-alanyl-D-alanine carboxypeptidase family protein [Afifella sp. YEN Y35]|uniref:D-alanyl-D-alanine carboxypeptidase family protein n=1 Tax=Afifella sp. YEN Y35 TaxID=3388337 RepID=UPI0039DF9F48
MTPPLRMLSGARLLLALLFLVTAPLAAAANETADDGDVVGPYLLVDAKSGDVLEEHDALRPWYPASTTKLMTAFVVFRALEVGEITLKSPVVMSQHAYNQPYAARFFKPGSVLTVDNALKVMLARSSNDMAMAIAESVGDGYDNFLLRMNLEAKRLGMTRTQFVNPHGLYSPHQVTCARDLALLTRAIFDEFPRYRHYFNVPAIKVGGAVKRNTNLLIGRYRGATGMKTGYICDSGWNLVATAQRGRRELIAVVLGADNGIDRAERAARLLDAGFDRGGGLFSGGPDISRINSGSRYTEPYDMRDQVCSPQKGKQVASKSNPIYKPMKGGLIMVDEGDGFKPSHIGQRKGPVTPIEVATGGVEGPGVDDLAQEILTAQLGVMPRPRPTIAIPPRPQLATAFAPSEEVNKAAPVDPVLLLAAPALMPRPRPDR